VATNGNIPSYMLGDVPGSNAGLLKPAALAYKAMHYHSLRVTGVSLHLIDGQVGRTYRSYARQVLAKRIYGSNAAWPGTSNHGWALATDLMTAAQRNAIDRIGAAYGWAKRWSDASWEWWHLKWRSGIYQPKPDLLAKLGPKRRKAAQRLLYHRRERKREARSGRGPRWRRHDRYVHYWFAQLQEMFRRADVSEQRTIMRKVLDDRDGIL